MVALENCFHSPRVPLTAHPSGVSPCLLRWLGSDPASRRTATTPGRPKKAAQQSAMASFSASSSVRSAAVAHEHTGRVGVAELGRDVKRIGTSLVGRAHRVGETGVLVQQRLHRRRVPTLYRAVQLLDLRHGWLLLTGKSTAKILALPALGSTTGLATQVMPLHVWIVE
jgi:hypothetical protein